MAYNPGYESYDPYLTRSLSRRQSMSYPGTPYPSVYPDGVAATDVSIFIYLHPSHLIFSSIKTRIKFMRLLAMRLFL